VAASLVQLGLRYDDRPQSGRVNVAEVGHIRRSAKGLSDLQDQQDRCARRRPRRSLAPAISRAGGGCRCPDHDLRRESKTLPTVSVWSQHGLHMTAAAVIFGVTATGGVAKRLGADGWHSEVSTACPGRADGRGAEYISGGPALHHLPASSAATAPTHSPQWACTKIRPMPSFGACRQMVKVCRHRANFRAPSGC
jgi:hypothetical protein